MHPGKPTDDERDAAAEEFYKGAAMTRTMIVEERIENKNEIVYELRKPNPTRHDDRLTLVIPTGDDEPQWRVGATVTVEIK
jgi:hypothetical protein